MLIRTKVSPEQWNLSEIKQGNLNWIVQFYRYCHGSGMEANTFCFSWNDAGVRIFQYSLRQVGGYDDVRVPGLETEKV